MDLNRPLLFDLELFDDLKRYLDDKKEALKQTLFIALEAEAEGPRLTRPDQKSMTLKEAVKYFDEEVGLIDPEALSRINFEAIGERFSELLKSLSEILEGMCKELFEQLKHSPVDRWNTDFCENVQSAKELIHENCKELLAFNHTLEKSLKNLYLKALNRKKYSFFKKIRVNIHPIIEPDILKSLKESDKLLTKEFKQFVDNQKFINQNLTKIEGLTYKFQGYQAFSEIDIDRRNIFVRVWRLLSLYNIARTKHRDSLKFIESSIKTLFPPGKANLLFRDYLTEIKKITYNLAKVYRGKRDATAQAVLITLRSETETLSTTIQKYRDFLIKTDPNPYVRSRFSEWIVGPEPRRTKELSQLVHQCHRLDESQRDLFDSQEGEDTRDIHMTLSQFSELEKILHDMGQPLTSRAVMAKKGAEFTHHLKRINEVTAPLPETSLIVQDLLIKILKLDSKYLTLQENPEFIELVNTHQGIFGISRSLPHLKRIKLYKKVLEHLRSWSKKHELSLHAHDAEVEVHDLQEAMQEFYHSLPLRDPGEPHQKALFKSIVIDLKRQLLEERLLFSRFFYQMKELEHESRIVRAELHFVDPYLEAIENRLNDLRHVLIDDD